MFWRRITREKIRNRVVGRKENNPWRLTAGHLARAPEGA
jgi:hypothetical protein